MGFLSPRFGIIVRGWVTDSTATIRFAVKVCGWSERILLAEGRAESVVREIFAGNGSGMSESRVDRKGVLAVDVVRKLSRAPVASDGEEAGMSAGIWEEESESCRAKECIRNCVRGFSSELADACGAARFVVGAKVPVASALSPT